jgi:hypothetical protein
MYMFRSIAVSFFVCAVAAPVLADQVKPTPSPLPKTGTLSVSASSNRQELGLPDTWGGNDPSGKEVAPIAGSVSRMGKDKWQVIVGNNSEDTYAVDVEVIQRDGRGSKTKSDFFSYTLKGGASQKQTVSGATTTESAELSLRDWRNLSAEKRLREKKSNPDGAATTTNDPGKGIPASQ